jgi:hypothetical protein
LWLSTTRGICRIPKQQLYDFSAHKRTHLEPENYGVEDGLRSAQCAPTYPVAGGGIRGADGNLWFTTSRGLAVLDPKARKPPVLAPLAHLTGVSANGDGVDLSGAARLGPGRGRLQIRYTGIHLSAPERVRYSYLLEGFESVWLDAGQRREANYNSLGHGLYRFRLRAEVPGGAPSEASWNFELLPRFWETAWFRLLCVAAAAAAAWAAYRLFAADPLPIRTGAGRAGAAGAGFTTSGAGIRRHFLAARRGGALTWPEYTRADLSGFARRMASRLTRACRSVMDLRASALEGQDLAQAIEAGLNPTAGSGVEISVESPVGEGIAARDEQHLLRIAQEAVTNVLKHAQASRIWVKLHLEARRLFLRIVDNGADSITRMRSRRAVAISGPGGGACGAASAAN